MILSEKKLENARMELQIEVPENKVEIEYEKVFNNLQKNAMIDGFRKGKAPLEIIISRFKENADATVAENIVKTAYLDALKEKELSPVNEPEVKFDKKIERAKPFKFNIAFDIAPTVKLGEYKNITVKENESKIVDSDIENEIQALRERYATVSKKEKGGYAEKGDYVRAEIKRIDNIDKAGANDIQPGNISLIVGKEPSDYSFDEDITGMRVDDEKETVKKYPKDYFDKELAGQKVKYLLKVIEISSLTLPALDDEFAKDLGDFSSLEDVRKKIREDMERFAKEKTQKIVGNELMGKIIESSKFDLPESMVIREMGNVLSRIERGMGLSEGRLDELISKGAIDREEFLKKIREEALQNIKSTLILMEVAKIENIKAPEDKYKEIIKSYSETSKKSAEEVEKILEENGSKENIEMELILNGTSEFIYKNANIKKQKLSLDELRKL